MQFICKFPCFPTPSRPNTSINFSLVNASKLKLCLFSSYFITKARLFLLKYYGDVLRLYIVMFFWFSALFKYKKQEAQVLSLNLLLLLIDSKRINDKLNNHLGAGRISLIFLFPSFVCSLLELVPINDSRFCKIHHIFFSPGSPLNNYIWKKTVYFHYTTLNNML